MVSSFLFLSCFFLYTRVFHFVIKKRKKALRPDPFDDSDIFLNILILIWPLSNFVRVSLEVTRTISNNKLYFTWGCSRPEGPETGFFFSQWFWHIFKYFNSNHNLPSYSLRCVLVVLFFTPPLARDSLSRSPRACLCLTVKRWKIVHVLQIQASSMKVIVHGFLFLGFLHFKTDGKNKLFF